MTNLNATSSYAFKTYVFFNVKKLRRLESSFCAEAGSVCDREGPDESASAWALMRDIHPFMSESSWACRRNSAPLSNLKWRNKQRDLCLGDLNSLQSENVLFLLIVWRNWCVGAMKWKWRFSLESLVCSRLGSLAVLVEGKLGPMHYSKYLVPWSIACLCRCVLPFMLTHQWSLISIFIGWTTTF